MFTQKCSQCHKLSRPINSDFALPDEWSRYVHRMMNKPGSGIDSGAGKKIYDFLVYDSSSPQEGDARRKTCEGFACGKGSRGSQDQGSPGQVRPLVISLVEPHLLECLQPTRSNCRT